VDITETLDSKLASLAEHVSQHTEGATGFVRERAEALGAQSGSGYTYDEGFKAFHLLDEDEDEEA